MYKSKVIVSQVFVYLFVYKSKVHRGRADYQAVSPLVQRGVKGGHRLKIDFGDSPLDEVGHHSQITSAEFNPKFF